MWGIGVLVVPALLLGWFWHQLLGVASEAQVANAYVTSHPIGEVTTARYQTDTPDEVYIPDYLNDGLRAVLFGAAGFLTFLGSLLLSLMPPARKKAP